MAAWPSRARQPVLRNAAQALLPGATAAAAASWRAAALPTLARILPVAAAEPAALSPPSARHEPPASSQAYTSWWQRLVRLVRLVLRATRLMLTFSPVALSYPVMRLLQIVRLDFEEWWWRWLVFSIKISGPTLIKWGQWASTRIDIFSANLCRHLSALHSTARTHSWAETEAVLTENLGPDWPDFLYLESDPVGSGCVAQVYAGTLSVPSAKGGRPDRRKVAVKIIHPGTPETVSLDLGIMRTATWALECIPYLRWLSLSDSLEEFALLMSRQLDLQIEASNLRRFRKNFQGYEGVTFPEPYEAYSSRDVLVESFVVGTPVADILNNAPADIKKQVAHIGMQAFLKMLFTDNLVHGDLHPGNMFVTGVDSRGRRTGDSIAVVFVDAGITTELKRKDMKNFVDLFSCIVQHKGREAGEMLLERSAVKDCDDPEGFVNSIDALIDDALRNTVSLEKIKVGQLLQTLLGICCGYRVRLESAFTSVVLSIMVLEGLGRSLDPTIDLVREAAPKVLKAKVKLAMTRDDESAPPQRKQG